MRDALVTYSGLVTSLMIISTAACRGSGAQVGVPDEQKTFRNCVVAQIRQEGFRIARQDATSVIAVSQRGSRQSDAARTEIVRAIFLADGVVLQAVTELKDGYTAGGPSSVSQVPSSPQLRSMEANLHRRCEAVPGLETPE